MAILSAITKNYSVMNFWYETWVLKGDVLAMTAMPKP